MVLSGVSVVLLDIEGTTTPITFVHDVLFPFARIHLHPFLRDERHADVVDAAGRMLEAEHAADVAQGLEPPSWVGERRGAIARYAVWLMDRDRKSPGLKFLQGHIWEDGYQAGELRGQVYADVVPAIERWRAAGSRVAIYSSGSELAQRRLFESTRDGDLTRLFSGFFDTGVGPKVAAASYARLAERLDAPPADVVFVSDVTAELAAARAAGVRVVLSVREGNPPQPHAAEYDAISNFAELDVVPRSGPIGQ